MPSDLTAFYSTMATLSPVLLLTVVLANRRAAANFTGHTAVAVRLFLVLPAWPTLLISIWALALDSRSVVAWVVVFICGLLQACSALTSFWYATKDLSITPS